MSYYTQKLAGRRLEQVYAVASPRVQQYLAAEVRHVLSRLKPSDEVLEFGCGYGRVVFRLAEIARHVIGIDTAEESLTMARDLAAHMPAEIAARCAFFNRDATDTRFEDDTFDSVVCIQNGICAFRVDPERLLREALRVTQPGGRVLLSSYTDAFWPHRLAWFEDQAEAGLLGPIDHHLTRNGVIACTDGFRSGRMTVAAFAELCSRIEYTGTISTVDESSVFCEIVKA